MTFEEEIENLVRHHDKLIESPQVKSIKTLFLSPELYPHVLRTGHVIHEDSETKWKNSTSGFFLGVVIKVSVACGSWFFEIEEVN